MKKTLMAIAIACTAFFVQASACAWGTYAFAAGTTTALEGGTYWLVSLGDSDAGLADLKVYANGTTDFGSYTYVDSGVMTGITEKFGLFGGKIEGLSAADNGSYYALVVWDGVQGGYYGKASGKVTGIVDAPPTDGTSISFDNSGLGYGATFADTQTENVPEPTALALLALGVAGLALRRKL